MRLLHFDVHAYALTLMLYVQLVQYLYSKHKVTHKECPTLESQYKFWYIGGEAKFPDCASVLRSVL